MSAAYNIILRALEPSDVDLLFRWENDRSIWKVSNTITPFSRFILEQYIESSHQDIYHNKQLRLMIDMAENGKKYQTVGAVDLFDFDPLHLRAGVGILIYDDKLRNRGIATAALNELIKYCSDILHLHQLYCNIAADNEASMKLFKNAGFRLAGIKKDWIRKDDGFKDEALLQLIFKE